MAVSDLFGVADQALLDEVPLGRHSGRVPAGPHRGLRPRGGDARAGSWRGPGRPRGLYRHPGLPGVGPVLGRHLLLPRSATCGALRRSPTVLPGRASDPSTSPVRHHGAARADHPAGLPVGALGRYRGHQPQPGRDLAPARLPTASPIAGVATSPEWQQRANSSRPSTTACATARSAAWPIRLDPARTQPAVRARQVS